MAVRQQAGRWVVEFQQSGHRVFRRLHDGASKAQATALETKLRNDLFVTERLGQKPELGLEDAILRWLRDKTAHKKDQRNPRLNARHLSAFVAGKSLREAPEAAREAIAEWRGPSTKPSAKPPTKCPASTLSGSGLSAATVNRRLCVLKAAAKHAYKMGWVDENVSGRITLLPEQNRREVYLTAAQVSVLAKAAPTSTSRAAIVIAAYTGLRASELLRLPATPRNSASLTVAAGKSGKPRSVPLIGTLRPYLRALPLGLSYRQLVGEFWVARKAAGLPHVRFHDLRHSCASMLINAGVDLYVVGAILGHSSPATTQRYAHLADKTLRDAMRKIG